MPFQKGKPKTGGRQKGTANAVTADLRQRIQDLLNAQFDNISADLDDLEPKERVNAWIRLLEFALPKLQRTEASFDFSKLSDAEIDALFAKALGTNDTEE